MFFIPFIKRPPKPDTAKPPPKHDAEKRTNKKSVSAVVFTNSVLIFGGGLQNVTFAESPIKIGVLAYFEKEKQGPKM